MLSHSNGLHYGITFNNSTNSSSQNSNGTSTSETDVTINYSDANHQLSSTAISNATSSVYDTESEIINNSLNSSWAAFQNGIVTLNLTYQANSSLLSASVSEISAISTVSQLAAIDGTFSRLKDLRKPIVENIIKIGNSSSTAVDTNSAVVDSVTSVSSEHVSQSVTLTNSLAADTINTTSVFKNYVKNKTTTPNTNKGVIKTTNSTGTEPKDDSGIENNIHAGRNNTTYLVIKVNSTVKAPPTQLSSPPKQQCRLVFMMGTMEKVC